ncbi:MAG: hypothetical protein JSW11_12270 [Candidatus Heimdallarchaeota archaeon]|nr:MAG: hypothetical protein JSW11_12270 [Candidatus Heimdallarchaeota archaeon]
MKTLFSIDDESDTVFLQVTVYHPDEVAISGCRMFNKEVLTTIRKLGGGVGVINFGVLCSGNGTRKLGEIYEAIKWAKTHPSAISLPVGYDRVIYDAEERLKNLEI